MAMLDKIWQGTGNVPTEQTKFLPNNFFTPIMPVSLEIDDIFSLKGSVPTGDEFHPIRSFFLDDLNAYLIFDVGNPDMVAIYLVDYDTKEMMASYTYMADTCPVHRHYDQFVDCCVHHDDMSKDVQVSFLIVNSVLRSVTIARFKLQVDHIRDPFKEANNVAYHIRLTDLTFFADLVAPGAKDELALPFTWATVRTFGGSPTTYRYPNFSVAGVIKKLRDTFHIGELTPKYCSLTMDEAGHYIVLIGSRLPCHLGPHLQFPVDTQYVVLLDQGGMNQRFVLIGPSSNFMCWDETEPHQATKSNATIFDGRHILCLEDRKSRYIAPRRIFVNGIETEPDGRSYTECTMAWRGGNVADVYYPPQQVTTTYPLRLFYIEVGYPSVWDEESVLEPIHREYIWTVIDICKLLDDDALVEPPVSAPYSADVVFMMDLSKSMGTGITQVQANVGTFVKTLQGLKVTDFRVGVAAYTTSQTFMTFMKALVEVMWGTTAAEVSTLASKLQLGAVPDGESMHNAGLVYVADTYKFRAGRSIPKYVVLITDTGDEGDAATRAQAILAMTNLGVKVCVVGYPQDAAFFASIVDQTGGIFYDITGAWGPRVSSDLAARIAADIGEVSGPDWWSRVATAWTPTILYNFNPVSGSDVNTYVTIFHDAVSYVTDGHVVKNSVNFLVVYDDYPVNGGMPQNSIYIPGIVPGETLNYSVVIRNESTTGIMKNIKIELVDLPPDVVVNLSGFPDKLEPKEMAVITVAAQYAPDVSPVARHIDVKYKVTYWMQHILACNNVTSGPPLNVSPVYTEELYFVSDTSTEMYVPGWEKEIPIAPMFTDAYITSTTSTTGDAAKALNMAGSNFYIIPKGQLDSANYEKTVAGPMSAIAGYNVVDTGCAWLKITGPINWHTQRDHHIDTNVITWWIVNKTTDASFVAHAHMEGGSIAKLNVDMQKMGFLLVEYPEGNIIPPGESRPVTFRWRPVFNPDGEQMTLEKTYHSSPGIQTGFPQTAWSTADAMFNNIIYAYPTTVPNFQFVHILEESVAGDGVDVTLPKDHPLRKFDSKLLTPYAINSELTVDMSTVVAGFPFIEPEQTWGGHRIDPDTGTPVEEVVWDGVAEPFEHYTYKEYASPAAGIECLPSYVDHRFKVNPDYKYHTDTVHPFQLAPFNKQYATDYVATAFYGNVIIKSETIANLKFKNMAKYDDDDSALIPCDAAGAELAGWIFEDFLPDPDYNIAIQRMATENEITFVREVYVKNRGAETIPVLLNVGPSAVKGLSLQGVIVDAPNPVPPNGVVKVTLTLRLHYGYNEAGYVNMIKQLLLIPRFNAPL